LDNSDDYFVENDEFCVENVNNFDDEAAIEFFYLVWRVLLMIYLLKKR
jgi:hypothetical protein